MNVIDIILGVLLILSFISGYRDGIIRKVFILAGTIIGLILATKYTGALSALLLKSLPISQTVASVTAFLVIFIGIFVVSKVIAKSVSHENILVKFWDKLLGGTFGLIEGGVILSLLLLFFNLLDLPPENLKAKSFLYDRVLNFAPTVFNVVTKIIPGSKDFYKEIGKGVEKYNIFKEEK